MEQNTKSRWFCNMNLSTTFISIQIELLIKFYNLHIHLYNAHPCS